MPSGKRIYSTLKLLIVFLLFDLLATSTWSTYALNAIEEGAKPDRFDAVLILMGDFNEDFTDLGEETRRRLNHAVALKDKYTVNTFLCLGGSRPRSNIIGADLMKRYLEAKGVSSSRVVADGGSFDTFGNWQDALEHIEQMRWKQVGIISSGLHLFRLQRYILDNRDDVGFSLLPFSYIDTIPRISLFELWTSVHYEWVTALVYSLPTPCYKAIVSLIRPQ